MKAYTDLHQSKKLAEILPTESADMSYRPYKVEGGIPDYQSNLCPYRFASWIGFPCWSLAALLSVLKSEIDGEDGETYQLNIEIDGTWWYVWYRDQYDEANPIETKTTEELIDACYEMIIKLHELKML